jgi:hypothetical protein
LISPPGAKADLDGFVQAMSAIFQEQTEPDKLKGARLTRYGAPARRRAPPGTSISRGPRHDARVCARRG